jgi:argininosuccinate lyase
MATKKPAAGLGKTKPGRKLWAGRFVGQTNRLVEAFTSSLAFDRRLYAADIEGSIAHCKTLKKAGILSSRETTTLIGGLKQIKGEFESARFPFKRDDEDIHMAIERRLTELLGPVGGKLHTGRSRNDQVATDLRLYLRDSLSALEDELRDLQRALVGQARRHLDVIMPGYTHLQRAQPVLFAHHLLAYVEMLERDRSRVRQARERANVMPLGSGALAGSNYAVDRQYTARLLGFSSVSENSLDAVGDRDFVLDALAAVSIIMMHLSRLSEELVLWSSQEFHFVDLPDAFCTGSSMMPQKKNPDVPELVRGKTGRVYGHLVGMLTVMKGLPLSYNRDLQEDKEALFDALDTVHAAVRLYGELIAGLVVDRSAIAKTATSGYLLATEVADYLVTKGTPFREAHEITGRIVRHALDRGLDLQDVALADLRMYSDRFEKDVMDAITLEGAVERKAQIGGTARTRVEGRLKTWEKLIG